jgi:hypothetical protein
VELDDNLNPYYVGSYGHYKYGRNGVIIENQKIILVTGFTLKLQ